MDIVRSSIKDIQTQFADPVIWQAFVNQLLKDFDRAQVGLRIDEISSLEAVMAELTLEIDLIVNKDKAALNRLLYLVDIPQEIVLQIVDSDSHLIVKRLAEVIAMRIYQKISFRLGL